MKYCKLICLSLLILSNLVAMQPENVSQLLLQREAGCVSSDDLALSVMHTGPFTYDDSTTFDQFDRMLNTLSMPDVRSVPKLQSLLFSFALSVKEYDDYLDAAGLFGVDAVLSDNFQDGSAVEIFLDILIKRGYRDLIFNNDDQSAPCFVTVIGVNSENVDLDDYLTRVGMFTAAKYVQDGKKVLKHIEVGNSSALENLIVDNRDLVNVCDTGGNSPLIVAIERYEKDEDEKELSLGMIQLLLDQGAFVNAQDHLDGFTPLWWAREPVIIELLLSKGGNLNRTAFNGETVLIDSINGEYVNKVKCLMDHGASKDVLSEFKLTALKLAEDSVCVYHRSFGGGGHSFGGCTGVVHALEKEYGKPSTSMSDAVANGDIDLVSRFLDCGEDVNQLDVYGRTLLHRATKNGDLRLAKFLVRRGATVDLVDQEDNTPLMAAAAKGDLVMAKFLVKCGASIVRRNEDGQNAIDIAPKLPQNDLATYLGDQVRKQAECHKRLHPRSDDDDESRKRIRTT